jgi:hypothetical protein
MEMGILIKLHAQVQVPVQGVFGKALKPYATIGNGAPFNVGESIHAQATFYQVREYPIVKVEHGKDSRMVPVRGKILTDVVFVGRGRIVLQVSTKVLYDTHEFNAFLDPNGQIRQRGPTLGMANGSAPLGQTG